MSDSLSPPDGKHRLQAATDFGRNLVVIAGAGTGKTSLLVERILTAIGSGRVEIDRLGAITFTEKAAGEMRQRLAEGLERLWTVARTSCEHDAGLEGDRAYGHLTGMLAVDSSVVAERALDALRNLDRARVETIHTFCAGLLREHPLEVGVQPDFAVDPGEMQIAVLEELWERFVSRELGSPAPRPELWSRVLPRFSLEIIRELAFALSSFQISEELMTSDGPAIPGAADLPKGSGVSAIDAAAVKQAVEVAVPFALEAREELLRRGYISFDGLLVLARDLLRDHPDVRDALKKQFRMLLVDEFQDTDPLQYDIVLYLGEREGGSARNAYEVELEPGRLFVVGDPKQSIYRFRGADYEAFRRAVTRIIDGGGRQLHLTANFRSVPQVIEPVNALFAAETTSCWENTDFQPQYDAIEPFRGNTSNTYGARDQPRVEVWTVDAGAGALAKERREAEGAIVAESIRQIVESDGVEYSDVTILLRAFTQLSDYLRPLREQQIPFVVDGGREFLGRPEVAHLLVILKALARPSDAAALLAYLRSPAGGVPDTELTRYAAAGGRWQWRDRVDATHYPDLSRAFARLTKLDDDTRDLPPDRTVRRVLDDTDLQTLSAAAFEGPQRVANLTKLAAAAADLAHDGRLSLIEVVEALEEGRTAAAASDSPLADEETDAVRIMTIHKAKGLENEIVIIPDLARETRTRYRAQKVEAHVIRTLAGQPTLAVKIADVANPAWQRFVAEELEHGRAEEVRVLYVGATRARERLIVLAAPSRRTASWVNALESWGYDGDAGDGAMLFDGRVRHLRRVASAMRRDAKTERPRDAIEAVERFDRAVARAGEPRAILSRPSEEESWRQVRGESGERAVRRPPSDGSARVVGIVVHRMLERWDGRDEARFMEQLGPIARSAAQEEGADAERVDCETREIFNRFLDSELCERLRAIDILGREMPVLERSEDGTVYRGTLDLLYRDRDNQYVVADYKTDREDDPAKLASRYGPQLAIYARAVQSALGLLFPPRAELWHLRTAERIVIESPSGAEP